jgi:hypothetical protein
MTDTNTAATEATAQDSTETKDKRKSTLEGMTGYRSFDSTDEATAYLTKCGQDFTDFAQQPFAMNGINDAGEYDPAVYTDDMRVRVAVLKNVPRTINGKKEPTTIKAIVVTPVPTLAALLGTDAEQVAKMQESNPAGVAWIQKVLDKELNHVAVRPLRDAENLETAVAQMPRTVGDFLESGRDAGGIMDTFNDTYKTISDLMGSKATVWAKARLNKSDLKKAMESTAFATEYYPALEDRGEGKDSLFVLALRFGQALAKKKGMDAAIFDKWLATRDQQTLAKTEDESDDDLSLDDLVADLADESENAAEVDDTKAEGDAAAE